MTASLLLRVGLILILELELTSVTTMADENNDFRNLIKQTRAQYWQEVKQGVPNNKREKEKAKLRRAMRRNYMALVHSDRSCIKEEVWQEAKEGENCANWILNKICSDSPPAFLGLENGLTGKKLEVACKKRVIELASQLGNDETEESCDELKHDKEFRSFDGECNNLDHPDWGRANAMFIRLKDPDYANGVSEPRVKCNGSDLPNPRLVSLHVHGSNENRTNPESATNSLITMTIGQFLDHDLTLALAQGVNCEPPTYNPECVNIKIPYGDRIFLYREIDFIELERDAPFRPHKLCSLRPREHVNTLTSFIDASQVYGTSLQLNEELRGGGGLLKDMEHPHGCSLKKLLPATRHDDFCVSRDPIRPCFLAGDERVNENQALMSIHTLFVREHNRIATFFIKNTPWESELIFQRTRKIVGAFFQFIIFKEWLPEVLGKKTRENFNLTLKSGKDYFTGYNKSVNPGISAAFATAAFRFGHSLVQEEFSRIGKAGFEDKDEDSCKKEFKPIPIKDFGNPFYIYEKSEGGIDAIWRGLVKKPAAEPDGKFSSSIQESLSRGEGDLSDLISINIQRARERGVPSYLTFRNCDMCNIQPQVKTFDDLEEKAGFTKTTREILEKLYVDVKDIDLFTGLLLEGKDPSLKGGLFGPTFQCLLADQFRRLRVGDRFWHENYPSAEHHTLETAFTPCQLKEIRNTCLARLICDNSDDINAMPARVFSLGLHDVMRCEDLPKPDLKVFLPDYKCKSDHSEDWVETK